MLGVCSRLHLPSNQQHPLTHLRQAMLSPMGVPQPLLQRADPVIVTSKALKALDGNDSLFPLSSPF